MRRASNSLLRLSLLVLCAGCVHVDPETGKAIPRGNQRYEYARVKRNAERLKKGMLVYDTLILLGSPAEKSKKGDVWIYLPERPAILLPSNALRLEFKDGALIDWSYRPIVLGARF